MNIQDWLSQLLSRPEADPLDWESYCVTMDDATWKALWRDIDATEAYEDGLEAGLRLLQATQQHRVKLGGRGDQANQILLYRSILLMLDKADRWDAYLAVWEARNLPSKWSYLALTNVFPFRSTGQEDRKSVV